MFLLTGRPSGHARDAMLVEAARLDALASDLRRIAEGNAPHPGDLVDVPVMHSWTLTGRPRTCLVGIGTRHPRLPSGPIMTTELWAMDEEAGWVRTLSRFYVLGKPAAHAHQGENPGRG